MKWAALLFLSAGCATVTPQPGVAVRFAIDAHVHVTMSRAAGPVFSGEPGSGELTWNPRTRFQNQVEVEHLEAAGVGVVLAALWPTLAMRPQRDELGQTLHQLDELERFALRRPKFAVAHSVAEAKALRALGHVVLVPQVEGGEGLHSVEDVDRLYAAGARSLTLVHFVSTQVGGAAKGQVARLVGVWPKGNEPEGLTPLGEAIVRRMLELGIIIDLAHASEALANDVLAITEKAGVPVINSHTGARAVMDIERNLSDALARRIADSGGFIGVTLYTAQLDTEEPHWLPNHRVGGCDDVLAHWLHFATTVDPKAVVLGSDLNSIITRPRGGGLRCPQGVRNTSDLPALWKALLDEGLPREALDGMGDRLFSAWEGVEARANPAEQAKALAKKPRVEKSLFDW